MCYPYNSSTRRLELKQSKAIWQAGDLKFISTGTKRFEETVKDILENIEIVEAMNITGGEPLQLDRMWQLMDRIPEKHAKNITLNYDTNLTKLEYKKWNVWQLIDKFKDVHFGVSCDHFGDKLAWIRYPIDVYEFEQNLQKVKDNISNINVTVSMLNIHDLYEIQNYYKEFNTTFYGIVQSPKMLSIRNLLDKNYLIEKYKNFEPMVIQELEKGIEYCHALNSRRNINFIDLFPEFH